MCETRPLSVLKMGDEEMEDEQILKWRRTDQDSPEPADPAQTPAMAPTEDAPLVKSVLLVFAMEVGARPRAGLCLASRGHRRDRPLATWPA
jgi:hypothetical protein